MKKAIIVHGNIASGKSTFCKHLLKAIGDYYKWVSIDNYRKEAYESLRSAPPYIKEKYAQKRYMEDLEQSNRVLIETTAVSRLWDKTMGKLRSDQADILFVRIVCPPDLCIERYKVRMHERDRAGEINYQHPSTMKKSIEDSVFFTMWNRHNVKDTIELDSSSMTVNGCNSNCRTFSLGCGFPENIGDEIEFLAAQSNPKFDHLIATIIRPALPTSFHSDL